MIYKSRLDYTHYTVTMFYITLCTLCAFFIICLDANPFYVAYGYILLLLIVGFAHYYYDREYILKEKYFVIRAGFFDKKIKYNDIKKCYITKNYHLSYATSHQRICLEMKNNKKLYISPQKMNEVLLYLINRR